MKALLRALKDAALFVVVRWMLQHMNDEVVYKIGRMIHTAMEPYVGTAATEGQETE